MAAAANAAPHLEAARSLPFRGTLDGVHVSRTPVAPPVVFDRFEADGQASLLGHFASVIEATVDFGSRPVSGAGTYTFTAANGDRLVAAHTGSSSLFEPGTVLISEVAIVDPERSTGRSSGPRHVHRQAAGRRRHWRRRPDGRTVRGNDLARDGWLRYGTDHGSAGSLDLPHLHGEFARDQGTSSNCGRRSTRLPSFPSRPSRTTTLAIATSWCTLVREEGVARTACHQGQEGSGRRADRGGVTHLDRPRIVPRLRQGPVDAHANLADAAMHSSYIKEPSRSSLGGPPKKPRSRSRLLIGPALRTHRIHACQLRVPGGSHTECSPNVRSRARS